MTREEMIEILIEDRINDWVRASNTDGLEEILVVGWEGYENYTFHELQEAIEALCEDNFDEETADKIKKERVRLELARIKKLKHSLIHLLESEEKAISRGLEEKEASEER